MEIDLKADSPVSYIANLTVLIDALESGEWERGAQRLVNENKYCCFGVAMKLAGFSEIERHYFEPPNDPELKDLVLEASDTQGWEASPPDVLARALGMKTDDDLYLEYDMEGRIRPSGDDDVREGIVLNRIMNANDRERNIHWEDGNVLKWLTRLRAYWVTQFWVGQSEA